MTFSWLLNIQAVWFTFSKNSGWFLCLTYVHTIKQFWDSASENFEHEPSQSLNQIETCWQNPTTKNSNSEPSLFPTASKTYSRLYDHHFILHNFLHKKRRSRWEDLRNDLTSYRSSCTGFGTVAIWLVHPEYCNLVLVLHSIPKA